MNCTCPLCQSTDLELFYSRPKDDREFWLCQNCNFMHVPKGFHLNALDEKLIYDLHDNDQQDQGYRKFLSRTLNPTLDFLSKQFPNTEKGELLGLDFGCGPGPTLTIMANEQGYKVENFDKYYANTPALLKNNHYHFITSTEVFEHLEQPTDIFRQLLDCLKNKGILTIMTKRLSDQSLTDKETFARWHYIQDPTHIGFFHINSFEWLAKKFNCHLKVISNDVVLFYKHAIEP